MKKTLTILLLTLLLLPLSFKASPQERRDDGAMPFAPPGAIAQDAYPESEDDIFSSSYERELLARRFFQKTLPPLNRRETIVWAFRTAKAGVLL